MYVCMHAIYVCVYVSEGGGRDGKEGGEREVREGREGEEGEEQRQGYVAGPSSGEEKNMSGS